MSIENYLDQPEVIPAAEDLAKEEELKARFEADRLADLCDDFMANGCDTDLRDQINGREFVVAYLPATGPHADIARSVETTVFAKAFKQSLAQVDRDYGKYDDASTFVGVIDVSAPRPKAAAALRIIDFDPKLGFKDVNDFIEDIPENPWIDEIKQGYFAPGEAYDPMTAWKRLGEGVGVDLKLEESQDIATHAAGPDYRGKHGELDSSTMLFFHACLRYALATKTKNLLAIFDLPPLANLQQFGEPFDVYKGIQPHPYGGPFDTMPAFCVLKEGMARIRRNDEFVGQVFIDGLSLNDNALMPNEYQPDLYSNQAVNL